MNHDNLTQSILEKVKEVKQKPRYVFVLSSLAVTAVSLFFLALAFYIFVFIIFLLSDSGLFYAPMFGLKGFKVLFVSLPWTLLVVAVVSLLVAVFISRRFEFSYKKPILNTLLGIIGFLIISHLVFIWSGAQKFIKEEAFRRGIPLAPESMRNLRRDPPDRLFVGNVIGTTSHSVIIQTRPGRVIEVHIATDTEGFTFQEIQTIQLGQEVKIMGERAPESQQKGNPVMNPGQDPGKNPRPDRHINAIDFLK